MMQLQQYPFVIAGESVRIDLALDFAALHLAKAAGVPEFVAEIAPQFHMLLVKEDILPERSRPHRSKTEGVRAITRDEIERIGRVTKALRHLAPDFVPHDAVEINVAKRLLAGVL